MSARREDLARILRANLAKKAEEMNVASVIEALLSPYEERIDRELNSAVSHEGADRLRAFLADLGDDDITSAVREVIQKEFDVLDQQIDGELRVFDDLLDNDDPLDVLTVLDQTTSRLAEHLRTRIVAAAQDDTVVVTAFTRLALLLEDLEQQRAVYDTFDEIVVEARVVLQRHYGFASDEVWTVADEWEADAAEISSLIAEHQSAVEHGSITSPALTESIEDEISVCGDMVARAAEISSALITCPFTLEGLGTIAMAVAADQEIAPAKRLETIVERYIGEHPTATVITSEMVVEMLAIRVASEMVDGLPRNNDVDDLSAVS